MAALKGAAALGALALASGRTLLGAGGGEGERAWAQPSNRNGCPKGMECCAPSRYMGWRELAHSEAACVSLKSIPSGLSHSCKRIDLKEEDGETRSLWVRANRMGQKCRPKGPVLTLNKEGGEERWHREPAQEPWAPGAVPPGGVGMHMIDGQAWKNVRWLPAHWWPSVGPPCTGDLDEEDEQRGCFLYDFWHKAPMRKWIGQVDVQWHGAKVYGPELHYDQNWPVAYSHQWPFPAFCARASTSMLSLVYNPELTCQDLGAGAKVYFRRWEFIPSKCRKVTYDKYREAMTRGGKKSCWNFVDDLQIVMCYKFWQCSCPEEQIEQCSSQPKINCCRSAFADFLTEQGLVTDYEDMIGQHAWTLERLLQTGNDTATQTGGPETGKHVTLIIAGNSYGKVHVNILEMTPLRQMMDMYCHKQGIQASEVDFLYKGVHIRRHASAKELKMQDGAKIEVRPKSLKIAPP